MGEIRKYSPDDCGFHAKFMEKYFPGRINAILKRSCTKTYYNWKYGANPHGDSIMYTYWEEAEILGTFGAIPVPLSIRGEKLLAYQVVDAFVAPQLRGKGIFRKLGDLVFHKIDGQSEICFGLGPSEDSLPIFVKKYDMYVGPAYRQVFSPICFGNILKAKGLRFISPLGNLISLVRNHVLPTRSFEVEEVKDIDPFYYQELSEDVDFCIIRDQRYVLFRYALCPEPYRFYKVHDDHNAVVLIVKFVDWRGIRICYLIDVIGRLEGDDSDIFLCQAVFKIGTRTSSALASVELHGPRNELSKLKYRGYFCHSREEVLFMRQDRWPFLRPSADDYDSKRWIIFSGDSDHI
jgi:hypothetical protein